MDAAIGNSDSIESELRLKSIRSDVTIVAGLTDVEIDEITKVNQLVNVKILNLKMKMITIFVNYYMTKYAPIYQFLNLAQQHLILVILIMKYQKIVLSNVKASTLTIVAISYFHTTCHMHIVYIM